MRSLSMPSASTLFQAYASLSTSVALFKAMLNQLLPQQLQLYIITKVRSYFRPNSSDVTLVIEERDGMGINEVYTAAEIYLSARIGPEFQRFKISKRPKDENMNVKFGNCGKITDSFEEIELVWNFVHESRKTISNFRDDDGGDFSEKRYFEISFGKEHKDRILNCYIPLVLKKAKAMCDEKKIVKLHSLANDLRRVLLSTKNRSILVIEDIDCSINMPERTENRTNHSSTNGRSRDPELTLGGLLNFIDGLWSSCGDERIIIFTTNHKEKLDPALLRPGRMDMHIHMSYLTSESFKVLTNNYLKIDDPFYKGFKEVEKLIEGAQITPAEVAEEFMKSEDPDICIEGLIKSLKRKRMSNEVVIEKQEQSDSEAKRSKSMT